MSYSNFQIKRFERETGSLTNLIKFLKSVDSDFAPHISDQIDIEAYVDKISRLAVCYFIEGADTSWIAFGAIYCNDLSTHVAYIPVIAVGEEFRRLGLGRKLLETLIDEAIRQSMKKVQLKTPDSNIAALKLYESYDFKSMGYSTIKNHTHKLILEKIL